MFKNNGLILAIFVMAFVGGIYALGVFLFKEIPEASSLFGHLLGIVGFILMLMTEFLYSFRKRSKHARWGKMSDWLEFHIFTGSRLFNLCGLFCLVNWVHGVKINRVSII